MLGARGAAAAPLGGNNRSGCVEEELIFPRAVFFAILGAAEGPALGTLSIRPFVSHADAPPEAPFAATGRAAIIWAVLGFVHGIVLFLSSLGGTQVIEDMRRGRFVVAGLAADFDYRRFGHRIP